MRPSLLLSTCLLLTITPAEASLRTGTITSTSVKDSSGSQGQTGTVGTGSTGSGSVGSSAGDGDVGVKRILHFSDIHLNISESSSDIPIQYGNDAPISLLTSALEYAQQVLPDPDFFLYTGDYVVHDDPSEEYAAEAVKVSVETMAKYFPEVASRPQAATAILGNTDTSPDYAMNVTDPDTEENPSIQAVSGAWNDSLTDSNLRFFNARGYLAYELDEKLVVLTLNTVPYSPKHTPNATTDNTDPFGQFQWLNSSLEGLRNSSKFAYIVGHIPPIIDAQDGSPMWEASYIDSYKKIVTKYADVVKAQIFGHTHSIEFRLPLTSDMESQDPEDVITADDNNSTDSSHVVPLFTAAAISPIFYSNPAFMVWDYHATTYELLDFTVYGTNISSDNEAGLDWHQIFKASTAYNVSSLSWSELNNFIVVAADDSEIVEQYYYNSQAQSYEQNSCEDSVCLTWYLCSMMWWSTPEDYTACLAAGSRITATSEASPALFSVAGLLLPTILALWV
ncbi:Acid sphingomyelinase-like phosphodiesterase 3a [Phytophthora boehmeriae]|uniref:Acid sphingomyelinase-like phosphodiesterase 3a n=1 Tax=Phytophthora boehmeriae TaxID=109152 RepID=A0A8T1WU31_9STRA|nr:Acid sphingomyelinase-like phosphodiesterase 3a [Phytophthora boehmeriae]